MDVLRKELNSFYSSQHLECESLDAAVVEVCKERIKGKIGVTNACCVITDASADTSYIIAGSFARLLGITEEDRMVRKVNSSDEDVIYNRLHPEDLVDKRMLEYNFFQHVDKFPNEEKQKFVARCRIRVKNRKDRYVYIDNSTQVLQLSPHGKVWLILCCYNLSSNQDFEIGISPGIINNETGVIFRLSFNDQRSQILTDREKVVLHLIREGFSSKLIASKLGISIHTVNRHRQNILEKLDVSNSLEAIKAAAAMKLF